MLGGLLKSFVEEFFEFDTDKPDWFPERTETNMELLEDSPARMVWRLYRPKKDRRRALKLAVTFLLVPCAIAVVTGMSASGDVVVVLICLLVLGVLCAPAVLWVLRPFLAREEVEATPAGLRVARRGLLGIRALALRSVPTRIEIKPGVFGKGCLVIEGDGCVVEVGRFMSGSLLTRHAARLAAMWHIANPTLNADAAPASGSAE